MVEIKLVHKLLLFIAVILSMVTLSKLFNGDKKEKVEKKVDPVIEKKYEKISQSIPVSSSDGTIPEDMWKHLFERSGSSFERSGSSPIKMPCNILNRPVTRLESTRYDEPKVEEPKITSSPVSDISQHVLVGNVPSPSVAFSISDSSIPDFSTCDRLLID
jgi:hypothetical protein